MCFLNYFFWEKISRLKGKSDLGPKTLLKGELRPRGKKIIDGFGSRRCRNDKTSKKSCEKIEVGLGPIIRIYGWTIINMMHLI